LCRVYRSLQVCIGLNDLIGERRVRFLDRMRRIAKHQQQDDHQSDQQNPNADGEHQEQ